MLRAATLAWWLLALLYPVWVALAILAWLGEPRIAIDAVPAADGRMVITRIHPTGAVWRSGAQLGDVLLEIDGVARNERTWRLVRDSGTEFRIRATSDGHVI